MTEEEICFKEVRKNKENNAMFPDNDEEDKTPEDNVFKIKVGDVSKHNQAPTCKTIALELKGKEDASDEPPKQHTVTSMTVIVPFKGQVTTMHQYLRKKQSYSDKTQIIMQGVVMTPPGGRLKQNLHFGDASITMQGTKETQKLDWDNVVDWAVVPFSNTETSVLLILDTPIECGKNKWKVIRFQCKDKGDVTSPKETTVGKIQFNTDNETFADSEVYAKIKDDFDKLDYKNQPGAVQAIMENKLGTKAPDMNQFSDLPDEDLNALDDDALEAMEEVKVAFKVGNKGPMYTFGDYMQFAGSPIEIIRISDCHKFRVIWNKNLKESGKKPDVTLKVKDHEKTRQAIGKEGTAFSTKTLYEMSKEDIVKLMSFFRKYKVKVIEKQDGFAPKEEVGYRKGSGRSSVVQSQSIEGSVANGDEEYDQDSFIDDENNARDQNEANKEVNNKSLGGKQNKEADKKATASEANKEPNYDWWDAESDDTFAPVEDKSSGDSEDGYGSQSDASESGMKDVDLKKTHKTKSKSIKKSKKESSNAIDNQISSFTPKRSMSYKSKSMNDK